LNRLAYLHENWLGGDAIQGDFGAVIFKPHSLNHFKTAEVQYCDVSLAQQWTGIVYVVLLGCHGYIRLHPQLM
jgi:hypothetical protein